MKILSDNCSRDHLEGRTRFGHWRENEAKAETLRSSTVMLSSASPRCPSVPLRSRDHFPSAKAIPPGHGATAAKLWQVPRQGCPGRWRCSGLLWCLGRTTRIALCGVLQELTPRYARAGGAVRAQCEALSRGRMGAVGLAANLLEGARARHVPFRPRPDQDAAAWLEPDSRLVGYCRSPLSHKASTETHAPRGKKAPHFVQDRAMCTLKQA